MCSLLPADEDECPGPLVAAAGVLQGGGGRGQPLEAAVPPVQGRRAVAIAGEQVSIRTALSWWPDS